MSVSVLSHTHMLVQSTIQLFVSVFQFVFYQCVGEENWVDSRTVYIGHKEPPPGTEAFIQQRFPDNRIVSSKVSEITHMTLYQVYYFSKILIKCRDSVIFANRYYVKYLKDNVTGLLIIQFIQLKFYFKLYLCTFLKNFHLECYMVKTTPGKCFMSQLSLLLIQQ